MTTSPLPERRPPGRRLKRIVTTSLTAVLLVTLSPQVPALAQPGGVLGAGPPGRQWQEIPPVPVREVAARLDAGPPLPVAGDKPGPVWPAAGTAVAPVAGEPMLQVPGGRLLPDGGLTPPTRTVKPGGLPVRVDHPGPASGGDLPAQVQVRVYGRGATERAAVRGVLLRVAPGGSAMAGRVRLSIDYTAFATAYGADWASRLRLWELPACVLSAGGDRGCVGRPLPGVNSVSTGTVAAAVDLAEGPVMLALQAGPSGPAGDYAATSLQPSSTWSAGGSSGGFTWSYPMRVPPGVAGPAPSVGLSYASQSVDGRHAASNNQPSWVGEGFEAWPGGFIERRYRGCADDMDGSNNSQETGDLCWVTDNAVLSLDGVSGELLYNSSQQRWHLRGDDGSRIERKTGANNGDNNGEYWVVTTTDGTQYWFGANRLPGWSSGDPVTGSTWTVPVFGNHPGEPCHATSFGSSSCAQAWRWNLDYVVDVHGNSMSFWYGKETNRYARNLDPADDVSYVRGGYLKRISYGTRRVSGADSVFSADPPAQVLFTAGDRCLSGCGTKDEAHWPDTPWDQECTGSTCGTYSPTFWTSKRLASVTTRVWGGSSYRNVERWTFGHSFPDPGDTTRAGLWLSSIAHQGLAGGVVSLPDITFTPVSLDNRVDEIDHSPAMAWHRIARIDTETGGAIAVTYSDRDCESSKPTPHTNTRRCYPVYWTPEGETDPVRDWFHKYVVTELREVDMVGEQPEVLHRYNYLGGSAWHYTDDDGLVDKDAKTWSVWRGYGRVGVTVGEGDTEATYTETRFFRGMHGDRLPSGTRNVDVTDSQGGTWPDEDWFAGMVREEVVFNGPGGPEVSGKINDPWASAPTASRTVNGDTVHARFTDVGTVWSRTSLDGGRGHRVTKVTTTFDSSGMPVKVDDFGEHGVSGDERCTTYAYGPRNSSAWLMDRVHRNQMFAVGCAAAADPSTLDDDDVISDTRVWFDGNDYGQAPTLGLPTRTEELSAWNASSPTYVATSTMSYDGHGRVTETRDALDRPTTTSYTPATGGPVTGMSTTNALGHVTTTTLDPALGLATRTVDPNGKQTDLAYDPLGRLTGVWLPGRDQASQTANLEFSYGVRDNAVTYVTSRVLNPAGNYLTSHALFDGLLREVQTQTASPAGGRLLTNTFYDNTGRAYQSYDRYYATGAPSTSLHVPVEPFDIPTQNRTLFDGAGRVTAEVFRPYNQEQWRTSYAYGGDRVAVTPPAGDTATTTITDVRGNTVELRQHQAATPTGPYDATSYDYDRKGQLVGVGDPAGNQWSYVYDLRGRQVETHDPDAGWSRMAYDDAGQLVETIDANNNVLLYKYDALGRKTHMYWSLPFGTPLALWTYDTQALGQLDQSIRFIQGQPYAVKVTGYTDWYQPTGIDVVIPSAETGLAGTYTTQYTYHVDGSPDTVAWGATADLPTEAVHYEYDDLLGLPTRLRGTLGLDSLTYLTGTDYNALGQVEQLTLRTGEGADAVRLGYDRQLETGRLTSSWVDLDASPYVAADVRYSYDPAGNITRIADLAPNPDDTQCFGYDHLRRLTQAWTPGSGDCDDAPDAAALGGPAPYWLSWSYDQVGNRLTQTDHQAGGDITTGYSYPPPGSPQPHTLTSATTGSVTSQWSYDAGGNTLTRPDGNGGEQSLVWDKEGHLFTITEDAGTTRYVYDAEGNRLITRDPAGKTLYLPGQQVRYDSTTETQTATRYYDYQGQTIASRNSSGLSWLATDPQGTAQVAIAEATQQVTTRRQHPFGDPRGAASAWPNPKGFVGGDSDPTGLTHLGAREYDPEIGRFISIDPIMDLTDPQQIHGYAYANNNPITYSDPTGLVRAPIEGGPPKGAPEVREITSDEGDLYQRNVLTGEVVINGVTIPPDLVADPYALFDEINAEIGKLPGSENRHNSPEDLAFYTIWAITRVCAGEANRHLQCGVQILELQQVFAQASTDRAGDPLNLLIPPVGGGLNIPPELLEAAVAAGWGFDGLRGGVRGGAGRGSPGRPATRPGCRNSFTPDTLVLMADGTHKPIQDVEVGDLVLATDPEAGLTQAQPVIDTITGHGEKLLVDITITTGSATGAHPASLTIGPPAPTAAGEQASTTATITATGNHPIWVTTTATWTDAADLQPGDYLATPSGAQVQITSVETHSETVTVHNLAIAEIYTYYVLMDGTPVLVHNAPPSGCRITSNAGSPQFASRTVWTNRDRTMRVDVENPRPGVPGAAGVHVQFRGRGADPAKYYYNPSNGTWVSSQGVLLPPRIAQQIPQSAINRANQYLGVP